MSPVDKSEVGRLMLENLTCLERIRLNMERAAELIGDEWTHDDAWAFKEARVAGGFLHRALEWVPLTR